MQLSGVHHLTAVSAKIRENHRFYTQTLGMRLVKRTVNQDDASAYHLFYADAKGTPGTDLTFFDLPAARERRGGDAITRTSLRVGSPEALEWWLARLHEAQITAGTIVERDGHLALDVEDGEGQRLTLIDDGGAGASHPWAKSPVPEEYQVRGLGPIVLTVSDLAATHALLENALDMRHVRSYSHPELVTSSINVYEMGGGGLTAELHVTEQRHLSTGKLGAGGVHHVAFRTPDADYDAWAERLRTLGIANSGTVDRFWFKSLYFREPNGILFEIASDGPGFSVDEQEETLGETLVLPPFLEPRRAEIVSRLKPID